jgi:chorismate synthase
VASAKRAAVLIALEDRPRLTLLVTEKVVGVKGGVTYVIVRGAVQLIGPALTHDAHDSARIAAVFCSVGALKHAEFGDGIGIRVHYDRV